MENFYDEKLEPSYVITMDSEQYHEILQEKDDKIEELEEQKETIEEKLEDLVYEIFEICNRENSIMSDELAEIIEYIHKEKLDEEILLSKK